MSRTPMKKATSGTGSDAMTEVINGEDIDKDSGSLFFVIEHFDEHNVKAITCAHDNASLGRTCGCSQKKQKGPPQKNPPPRKPCSKKCNAKYAKFFDNLDSEGTLQNFYRDVDEYLKIGILSSTSGKKKYIKVSDSHVVCCLGSVDAVQTPLRKLKQTDLTSFLEEDSTLGAEDRTKKPINDLEKFVAKHINADPRAITIVCSRDRIAIMKANSALEIMNEPFRAFGIQSKEAMKFAKEQGLFTSVEQRFNRKDLLNNIWRIMGRAYKSEEDHMKPGKSNHVLSKEFHYITITANGIEEDYISYPPI
ncbi:hypothetical protein Ddc_09487 [Ditylenchus destructor]|nr:hypothetical protein Ddc_09487 [Ditylenchus destructor]